MNRYKEIEQQAKFQVNDTVDNELAEMYFIRGAEWADTSMLDKVCEWLDENIWDYIEIGSLGDFEILKKFNVTDMLEDLRNKMED